MGAEAERKVFEIKDIITSTIEVHQNPGLLSGLGGQGLFVYYFEEVYNIPHTWSNKMLDVIIENLAAFPADFSYCSGIPGICYLIASTQSPENIETEIGDEINRYLSIAIRNNIAKNTYEFLYGLTGIANFLLKYPHTYANELTLVLNHLYASKRHRLMKRYCRSEPAWRQPERRINPVQSVCCL